VDWQATKKARKLDEMEELRAVRLKELENLTKVM